MGPSLKPYPRLGQIKNWVFKMNYFGQEMKAYHTSPHKLLFSTPPENPVSHLATKRWQRESFVVECCFDYFNRKIVNGLVSPYGPHTWQRRDGSAKVLLLNAVLTISTCYWLGFTLWITTKEFHLLVSNSSLNARQFKLKIAC